MWANVKLKNKSLAHCGQRQFENINGLPGLGKRLLKIKQVCPQRARAFGTTDCTDYTDLCRNDSQRNIRLIRAIRCCFIIEQSVRLS